MMAPAAVAGGDRGAGARARRSPYTYDNFLWDTQVLLAIFVAAQAPELVSSDQRHRVLSLYFSHALERTDYALAKLAALAAAVFGMALAPMLVLFLGRVLLAQDVAEAFGDEIENLPQVVGAPLLYAIPLAGLSLAIAAYHPAARLCHRRDHRRLHRDRGGQRHPGRGRDQRADRRPGAS